MSSSSKLFEKVVLGGIGECSNRVVMAPLTRLRAEPSTGVLPEYSKDYYRQRASAGMIIVEATNISAVACGYAGAPGIWSDEQVARWKTITDAVHSERPGAKIVCQLWHTGAVGHEKLHPGRPVQAPSSGDWGCRCNVIVNGEQTRVAASESKEMTKEEIKATVADYANATRRAKEAGFDGVEVHGAHGYLLNQFMCGAVNKRTDEYGCQSVENRCRFLLEVIDACMKEWQGPEGSHVGVRVSPYGIFNNIPAGPDIKSLAKYLFAQLETKGLAYVHLSEPEWAKALMPGSSEWPEDYTVTAETYSEMRAALKTTKFIGSGGYTKEKADKHLDAKLVDAVAFGRWYIANPDLVERLRNDWPVATFDAAFSYRGGERGYTDYSKQEPTSPSCSTVAG